MTAISNRPSFSIFLASGRVESAQNRNMFGGYRATELSLIPSAVVAPNSQKPNQKERRGASEP